MAATAFARGWPIKWDGNAWVYADTQQVFDDSRPCVRCGLLPTVEGYDACLRHIPGASSACCGHGVEDPVVIREL